MATVLITGAGRGIGLALASQYAEQGDSVIACVRDPDSAAELRALAGDVRVQRLVPGDPASIEAAAADVGPGAIDVLINNAGSKGGDRQSLDDIDVAAWIETFEVNAVAPLLMARAFKPNLLASGSGKLMTVTSQLAASTWPMGGMYGYSTTKAAVNKAMQALAIDWKDEPIVVAMVHPGWVRTEMGGPRAQLSAEESASGIRSVIAGLTKADSGKFYKWNGEIHPW